MKDSTPLLTLLCGEEIISTKPRSKRLFVCIYSFVWFATSLHNMYFIRPWLDIAYLCWKCR